MTATALVILFLTTAGPSAQSAPQPGASERTAPTPARSVPNQRPGSAASGRQPAPAPTEPALSIGEAAPPLQIERWVKNPPTTSSGSARSGIWAAPRGSTTVVEFWASWCTPCAQSMPRLTELQAEFRDRGVLIIGIASQENSAADLERHVARQEGRIGYTIALDDNGASNQAWMTAARQRSIPTAFIVDPEGRIAWIGHPLDGLDAALRNVVSGTHDLAAAAAAQRRQLEMDRKSEPLLERFRTASEDGEHEAAIGAADELIALNPDMFGRYAVLKLQIQAVGLKDLDATARDADRMIAGPLSNSLEALLGLAQVILDDPRIEKTPLLPAADRAAARACQLAEDAASDRLGAALSLRARISAERGNFAEAVAHMNRAVEAAATPADRQLFERRLAEYKKKVPPA